MSKYSEMLKFKEEEYRNSAKLIGEAKPIAEEIANIVTKDGFSNIFFTAVGGSLAPLMAMGEIAKQLTELPVYVEQAAELIVRGHKALTEKSLIITLSKSGDTKETVEMAKKYKEMGIRVISCTKNLESPLAKNSNYVIPMRHENGVEYEYMLLFWLFFKILSNRGEFLDYNDFGNQLLLLPENLLEAKLQFDPQAKEMAKQYYKEPYMIWIGGGEVWGETYLFSMCLLEEMQWLKTKSVTSSEFFHGTLEIVEEDTCVFLVKGSGKTRVLDDRAEKFLKKYTKKLSVIDTLDFKLNGIDEKYRWIIAPTIASTVLVDRLAFHFEDNTKHSLDIRRYYRQFDY